ncbi:ferritin-like domain-containing protein [Ferrovibrio sp.]|uniref:ferritin-like domain-containing protein n=1 Tax=Ferrovibrio sp. TaxID=1917215 RepID=UPI003D12C188
MPTSPTTTSSLGALPPVPVPIINRPLSNLPADISAAKALAQAAINVELFTIPLYMAAMTSLQGVHEINASGITYYEGRAWPGMNTSATATTPNQQAYNAIFAVFIEEMLHLQLAANVASALGAQPSFTSAALQTSTHGWTCYGASNTTIPHIVNLTDLVAPYSGLVVNLNPLTVPQTQLFQLIEQDHDTALNNIQPAARSKYFPTAPFAGWTTAMTEQDLPLFGTIGWMYYCYMQYITMVYTDGSTLFEKMFVAGSVQQDMFNSASKSHAAEYPLMPATITAADPLLAMGQAVDMMLAITDQGEGAGQDGASLTNLLPAKARLSLKSVKAVKPPKDDGGVDVMFQPDAQNLAFDYPSYNSDGSQAAQSADATARGTWGATTHYDNFVQLQTLASTVTTFPAWFKAGNSWTAALLTTTPANPSPPTNIPSAQQVADALNALSGEAALLNTVATGAIAGITLGLNQYWASQSAGFPYPAMVGAGDRMTMCWAANSAPDLSQGLTPQPDPGRSPSACQGLNYQTPPASPTCGTVAVFHSCRGTNTCSGQGGCGFAQPDTGSPQTCSAVAARRVRKPRMSAPHGGAVGGTCGGPTPGPTPGPTVYSSPGDNACQTLGGCAVPISASQLYPESGTMQVYNLFGASPQKVGTIPFALGDAVFDVAWQAYTMVMQGQGVTPTKPAPSTLRIALPPST